MGAGRAHNQPVALGRDAVGLRRLAAASSRPPALLRNAKGSVWGVDRRHHHQGLSVATLAAGHRRLSPQIFPPFPGHPAVGPIVRRVCRRRPVTAPCPLLRASADLLRWVFAAGRARYAACSHPSAAACRLLFSVCRAKSSFPFLLLGWQRSCLLQQGQFSPS